MPKIHWLSIIPLVVAIILLINGYHFHAKEMKWVGWFMLLFGFLVHYRTILLTRKGLY